MAALSVLVVSMILQITAAYMALRLIPLTGRRIAWTLIAAAVFLMACRRGISLIRLVGGDIAYPLDLTAELVALSISILMVTGIAGIPPLFRARIQAEAALRDSETRYRTLVEGSIQGMMIVSRDGRRLFANPAFLQIMGYESLEAYRREPAMSNVVGDERARMNQYIEGLWQGDLVPSRQEYRAARVDGSVIWLEHQATWLDWNEERVLLSTVVEITERKQAEQALQASEELFRTLSQVAPVGIFRNDVQGHCTFVNDRILEITGITANQALGNGWMEWLHADDRSRIAQAWEYTQQTKRPFREEYRFTRPDSALAWVTGEVRAHRSSTGEVTGYIGAIMDVTERKQAETARLESETRFRNLIEGSIQGIIIHRDFKPLFVNSAYATLFGYSDPNDILQMETVVPLLEPQELTRLRQFAELRLQGRDAPSRYEHRGRRRDGRLIWLENVVKVVRWEGDLAIQSTVVDITERKRAVATLSESEARFRDLIEGSLQGVVIHRHHRPIFCNQAYADIYGYNLDELLGLDSLLPLSAPHEHDRLVAYREARIAGQPVPDYYDLQGIRKDGILIDLRVSTRQVNWGGDPAEQAIVVDITQAKQAEALMLRQSERLAALGTFASGIAHELNNPLGAIRITAEHAHRVLEGSAIPNEVSDCLNDILTDTDRCTTIVQRVLHFSHEGNLDRVRVDLHRLLQSVGDLVQLYAREQDVGFVLRLGPARPCLRANAEAIELVFVNLVRNAVEASQADSEISLWTEVEADRVRVFVQDAGIGLTAVERQQVFDPFYTTSSGSGGTGLGLSIARRIVTDHGGTIALQSMSGVGTTVVVGLPLDS